MGFLVAQLVKNSPAVQETPVPSLGWKDPVEEDMATFFLLLLLKNTFFFPVKNLPAIRETWVGKIPWRRT